MPFTPRDLLVRAAFHDEDTVAAEALAELVDRSGGEHAVVSWALAGSEQRLLPGLGQRSGLLDNLPELAEKCADLTAQAWGLNERLCLQVRPFIDTCGERGIELLALKGVGLLGSAYPDHPMRPAGDADLYVDPRQAKQANQVATDLGWHGPESGWYWFSAGLTTQELVGPRGGSIDLHHRPGRAFRYGPRGYTSITASAKPLEASHPLAASALRVPDDDWQLLVVATHAANPANTHVCHPVVDIHRLITRTNVSPARVAELAAEQRVTLRVLAAVEHSIAVLDTPFDTSALAESGTTSAGAEQRVMEIERLLADDEANRRLRPVQRMALTVAHDCHGRGPWARMRMTATYVGNGRHQHRQRSHSS